MDISRFDKKIIRVEDQIPPVGYVVSTRYSCHCCGKHMPCILHINGENEVINVYKIKSPAVNTPATNFVPNVIVSNVSDKLTPIKAFQYSQTQKSFKPLTSRNAPQFVLNGYAKQPCETSCMEQLGRRLDDAILANAYTKNIKPGYVKNLCAKFENASAQKLSNYEVNTFCTKQSNSNCLVESPVQSKISKCKSNDSLELNMFDASINGCEEIFNENSSAMSQISNTSRPVINIYNENACSACTSNNTKSENITNSLFEELSAAVSLRSNQRYWKPTSEECVLISHTSKTSSSGHQKHLLLRSDSSTGGSESYV